GDVWYCNLYSPYLSLLLHTRIATMQFKNAVGFYFFFQAEDGIRDATETGVQTCALPISPVHRDRRGDWRDRQDGRGQGADGRDRRSPDGRGLRHLAAELERMSVAELIDHERAQGPEAALSSIECHRCPWGATARCDREWREL